MKIKRILVEEKEYVMGEIECFLCRQGISYVKVENEIHIPNLILRFYEFEEYLSFSIYPLQLESILENHLLNGILLVEPDEPMRVFSKEYSQSLSHRVSKRLLREFIVPIAEGTQKEKASPYPPFQHNKRKQLQMENGKVMKKIKS